MSGTMSRWWFQRRLNEAEAREMAKVTIEVVREKIAEMSDKKLAKCYLKTERHWGYCKYWLVFTEEDVRDKVEFDRIHEVMDWLNAFEKRNRSNIEKQPVHPDSD